MTALGGRRFRLPDGSDRYLVDEDRLMRLTERRGGVLLEPLKTTVVQNQCAVAAAAEEVSPHLRSASP